MKILFFFENNWVFGKIHNELCKTLHPDIYCDIADWGKSYNQNDFQNFLNKYNYIMTTPHVAKTLLSYNIPHEKIIAIAHSDYDIFQSFAYGLTIEDFKKFKGYCVISPKLLTVSIAYKIPRIPKVLRIGLFTNNYPRNKNKKIYNIGFFSKLYRDDCGFDLKRGSLVKEVSSLLGIPFIHYEDLNFLGIEKSYSDVSLMMFASLTEGNPYAALEAFACGIPVLGTDVGIFPDIIKNGGGKIISFEKDLFINQSCSIIKQMNEDECLYTEMSEQAYQESKKFDWCILRETWINYFNSL